MASRPEMLRRLARDMLQQRGLLKVPGAHDDVGSGGSGRS